MKQRSLVVVCALVLILVSFLAGLVAAKGKGLLRLDLPGRSDERPYTQTGFEITGIAHRSWATHDYLLAYFFLSVAPSEWIA